MNSLAEARADIRKLNDRNQWRLDELLRKNTEILDNRLGLTKTEPAPQNLEPLSKRQSWTKIRSDYEAKKRKEFWENRIAAVETQDTIRDVETSDTENQNGPISTGSANS